MKVPIRRPGTIGRYLPGLIVVGTSVAVTLWFALARGQDFNWDQQNYHIGVPFLLQKSTFWSSIAPAGVQSFYNPTVFTAEYAAIRHLSPMTFAVAMGLSQSVGTMLAGLICLDIAKSPGSRPRRAAMLGLAGFVLCLAAPMVLSEAGTTFIDSLTAVPVVTAFALLLSRDRYVRASKAVALAGGLIGAVAALKPTNAVFALGAVGFALAGPETVRRRVQGLVLYGFAAVAAFLAVGGRWYLTLWEHFRNPVFPYLNTIFRSADFGDADARAERFLPHSPLDVWRYPLYWMFGGSPNPATLSPSAEVAFRDARWAVLTIGGTIFLVLLPTFPAWRKRQLADPATGLFFAVILSYLIWLGAFAIQRYLAPADLLCGAALLFLALQLPHRLARTAVLAGTAVLSLAVVSVPDWTHLPWRSHWQGIETVAVPSNGPTLVFLTAKPSLYIAAGLPADWRYVGGYGDLDLRAGADTTFTRQLRQTLATSPALSLKEVDRGTVPAAAAALLASYGLSATADCLPLRMPDVTLRLCDVARAP